MFSPDAVVPGSVPARNPRRRQRSDDSVAIRRDPKRLRRTQLTSETFQDPETTNTNGHIGHAEDEHIANGHAKEPRSQSRGVDAANLAIRHRGVKKAERERRTSRNDGSIQLASAYTVIAMLCNALTFSTPDKERELCRDPASNNSGVAPGLSNIRYGAQNLAPLVKS